MKNKVDISKLIEKKYKGNTLELSDILEQIDLVLQETVDYKYNSKIDTGNLEEIDPGHARDIANRKNGNIIDPSNPNIGAPRQEIPGNLGRDPQILPQVRPDKIAEAPQQGLQKDVQFTVKIPDLYSMMTNIKSMEPASEDRKFINDIIKNINAPTNNWLGRVRALQQYTKFLGQPQAKTGNISEAISSMILLNVLKKISFFTEQPGKQFEYLFAPFIHAEAAVVGSEQTEVDDINSPNGKISLKFLQTTTPVLDVSQENLESKIGTPGKPWEEGQAYPFIDYIIVRCFGNGNIQFGRTGLTNNINFVKAKYQVVSGQKGSSNILMALKTGADKGLAGLPPFIIYTGQKGEIAKEPDSGNIPSLVKSPLQGQNFDIGGIKIPAERGIANKRIPELSGKTLPQFIQSLKVELESEAPNRASKIAKMVSILPDYQKLPPNEKNSPEKMLQIAQSIVNQYASDAEAFKKAQISQTRRTQQEYVEKNKELLNENLSISLTSVWNTILVETLSLGEVNKYNEQQLIIGSDVQKLYADVLNNLNSLNTNLTKYFATAQGKNEKAGDDAINNANEIVTKVNEIKTSKKK
jgi:predicted transcriptional regulator